jgi:hypothetical protein
LNRRAVVVAMVVCSNARADDVVRTRPAVRVDLAPCLDAQREAIEQAVRVELGDRAAGGDAVVVRVDCASGGAGDGIVVEVQPPTGGRHYRYALDWRAQPADMQPRLVGLAVVEAVEASQLELVAVAEPAPAAPVVTPAIPQLPWAIGFVGGLRSFGRHAGVTMLGGGIEVSRAWSRQVPRLRLAIDVVGEGDTVLVSSGAIDAVSVSSAPRAVYRFGDRIHADVGVGVRIGVARMRGETFAGDGPLVGNSFLRPWFGPVASAALGLMLDSRITIDAGLEVGIAAYGATAHELSEPAAVIDGRWIALGIATTIEL